MEQLSSSPTSSPCLLKTLSSTQLHDHHLICLNDDAAKKSNSRWNHYLTEREPNSGISAYHNRIDTENKLVIPTMINPPSYYHSAAYLHTFSDDSTTPSTIYGIREVPNSDITMLHAIARFRFDTWCAETKVNESLFPDGLWLEDIDYTARHWITEDIATGKIVATARMTVHDRLEDNLDGHLWIEQQKTVPLPVGHLSKLVVDKSVRKLGIGRRMSELRMSAAQAIGAKSMLVTASVANARLLFQLGWVDTGIRVVFPDRPDMEFMCREVRF